MKTSSVDQHTLENKLRDWFLEKRRTVATPLHKEDAKKWNEKSLCDQYPNG